MQKFCGNMFCCCGRRHKRAPSDDTKVAKAPEQPKAPNSPLYGEETTPPPQDNRSIRTGRTGNEASTHSSQGLRDSPSPQRSQTGAHTGVSPAFGAMELNDSNSNASSESHSPISQLPRDDDETNPNVRIKVTEVAESDSGSESSDQGLYMGGSGMGRAAIKMRGRKDPAPAPAPGDEDTMMGEDSDSDPIVSGQRKRKRKALSHEEEEHHTAGTRSRTDSDPSSSKRRRLEPSRGAFEISVDQSRWVWASITPSAVFKPTFDDNEINDLQRKGAQYQAWLADPNEPGCTIRPATLSINDLINAPAEEDRFDMVDTHQLSEFDNEEYLGSDRQLLRPGDTLRYTRIMNRIRDPQAVMRHGHNAYNDFIHAVGRGFFIAINIYRFDGPQWCEVARAMYEIDYPIDTLETVLFDNIANQETAGLLLNDIYPKTFRDPQPLVDAGDEMHLTFEYGTPRYQQILGTQLGKSVAILLLSSFPRGTMRIARFITRIADPALNMRVEIEKVTPSG